MGWTEGFLLFCKVLRRFGRGAFHNPRFPFADCVVIVPKSVCESADPKLGLDCCNYSITLLLLLLKEGDLPLLSLFYFFSEEHF